MADAGPAADDAILWAEDDPMDQELVRAIAAATPGAPPIRFVEDGVQVLDALASWRPSLLVLDLKMPRMGGLDALRRLRGDPATAGQRVVVFSSGSIPDELRAAAELGALAVVQKPIQFDALSAQVRRILALAGEGGGRGAPSASLAHAG